MIRCEECSHDPIPNCSVCEELAWLHEFRNENKKNQEEEEWLTAGKFMIGFESMNQSGAYVLIVGEHYDIYMSM